MQAKASNNYLALRNTTGSYFINGNWRTDFAGQYDFAGTTFFYERKHKGKKGIDPDSKANRLMSMFAPEQIRALGPTQEGLYVVVSYSSGYL